MHMATRRVSDPKEESGREGAGAKGRLAGPRPPAPEERIDTPVMGVVPPDPNMPDEAGDMDYARGDATRVREQPHGSETSPGEEAADEQRRRELHRRGASEISKG
jgi:hypothetical protein